MAKRSSWRPKRALATVGALAFAALTFGFVLFATYATRPTASQPQRKADAIVVLTGGKERIGEAAKLLRDGLGQRLLISGVNRRNSKDDVRRLTGLDAARFDCCVDIGYQALDTMGNADEARHWADAWGFNRLIVVTASYHMPRSMTELARALPAADLIAHPVLPKSFLSEPWWLSPATARLLAGEYIKLLPSAFLYAAHRLYHLGEPSIAAANETTPQVAGRW